MRMVVTTIAVQLATLALTISGVQAADTSGSGVAIGIQGEILTNSHVVENCAKITVQLSSNNSQTSLLVARDQKNDLAVIRIDTAPASVTAFRDGTPIRAGDTVVALGYPLTGLLASSANLSVGNVSAVAGLGDDYRYFQISAPVQSGNSGGPLLDASGHLVGIVTAKLNAVGIARFTGDIPQNVNFAIKAEVARAFLDSRGVKYQTGRSEQQLSTADVGDTARQFAAYIECRRASSHSVVTGNPPPSKVPSNPPPSRVRSCAETAREFEARVTVFNAKCTGVGSISQAAFYRECAGEKASL